MLQKRVLKARGCVEAGCALCGNLCFDIGLSRYYNRNYQLRIFPTPDAVTPKTIFVIFAPSSR